MKPNIRQKAIVLAILCLFASSCSLFQKDAVTAKTENRTIYITNTSNETVYYILYPARVMQYITLVPTCIEQNAIMPVRFGLTDRLIFDATKDWEVKNLSWCGCKPKSTIHSENLLCSLSC